MRSTPAGRLRRSVGRPEVVVRGVVVELRVVAGWARLLAIALLAGGQVEFQGKQYLSPFAATETARATVTGRKMNTNGWSFWQIESDGGKPRTFEQVRDAHLKG